MASRPADGPRSRRLGYDVPRHRAPPPSRPAPALGHPASPPDRAGAARGDPPPPARRLVVAGRPSRRVQHRPLLPFAVPGGLPVARRPGLDPAGDLAPGRDGARRAGHRRAGGRRADRGRRRRCGGRRAAGAALTRPPRPPRSGRRVRLGGGLGPRVRADQAMDATGRPAHPRVLAAGGGRSRAASRRLARRGPPAAPGRSCRRRLPVADGGRDRPGLLVLVHRAARDACGGRLAGRPDQPGGRHGPRGRDRRGGVRADPGRGGGAGARRRRRRPARRPRLGTSHGDRPSYAPRVEASPLASGW